MHSSTLSHTHTLYRTELGTKVHLWGPLSACFVKILLQVFHLGEQKTKVCMWQLEKVKGFQTVQEWTCREGSQEATWS